MPTNPKTFISHANRRIFRCRRRPFAQAARCESLESRLLLTTSIGQQQASDRIVLVDEDFEDGSIDGFSDVTVDGGGSWQIVDGESDGAGNRVWEISYPDAESEAKASVYDLQGADSIEISFSTKLPDGIRTNDGLEPAYGNLKQSRVWTEQPGEHGVTAALWKHNATATSPESWEYLFYYGLEGEQERFHYLPIDAPVDKWLHVRYFMKWNTPGNADGVFMIWLNDELKIEEHDVTWTTTGTKPAGAWIGGNFSRQGTPPAEPFRRLTDNVMIAVNGDAQETNEEVAEDEIDELARLITVEHGLKPARSDFYDWGGRRERWVSSGDGWYFITPDGSLFKWNGSQPGQLTGELVATLDSRYHADIQLFAARPDFLPGKSGLVQLDETYEFQAQQQYWLNWGELQEKWFKSEKTGDWFYLTPDGDFFEWTGGGKGNLTGVRIANVTTSVYEIPALLHQATAIDVDERLGLSFAGNYYQNWGGQAEKWLRGSTGWYYLTSNGGLYRWDYSQPGILTGALEVELDHSYYESPRSLFDALDDLFGRWDNLD